MLAKDMLSPGDIYGCKSLITLAHTEYLPQISLDKSIIFEKMVSSSPDFSEPLASLVYSRLLTLKRQLVGNYN